jgi:hypothetical protein
VLRALSQGAVVLPGGIRREAFCVCLQFNPNCSAPQFHSDLIAPRLPAIQIDTAMRRTLRPPGGRSGTLASFWGGRRDRFVTQTLNPKP